jgi:hypothetical protein
MAGTRLLKLNSFASELAPPQWLIHDTDITIKFFRNLIKTSMRSPESVGSLRLLQHVAFHMQEFIRDEGQIMGVNTDGFTRIEQKYNALIVWGALIPVDRPIPEVSQVFELTLQENETYRQLRGQFSHALEQGFSGQTERDIDKLAYYSHKQLVLEVSILKYARARRVPDGIDIFHQCTKGIQSAIKGLDMNRYVYFQDKLLSKVFNKMVRENIENPISIIIIKILFGSNGEFVDNRLNQFIADGILTELPRSTVNWINTSTIPKPFIEFDEDFGNEIFHLRKMLNEIRDCLSWFWTKYWDKTVTQLAKDFRSHMKSTHNELNLQNQSSNPEWDQVNLNQQASNQELNLEYLNQQASNQELNPEYLNQQASNQESNPAYLNPSQEWSNLDWSPRDLDQVQSIIKAILIHMDWTTRTRTNIACFPL